MKSLIPVSISCLFVAAAAKPFIDERDSSRSSSWAYFRSYPYAVQADAEMAAGNFPGSAHRFALALARDPSEPRYSRGLLSAWRNATDLRTRPMPPRTQSKTSSMNRLAMAETPQGSENQTARLQPVRYYLAANDAERRQQTNWHGPIVSLASANSLVPFQDNNVGPKVALNEFVSPSSPTRAQGSVIIASLSPQTLSTYSATPSAILPSRISVNASSTMRSSRLPGLVRGATEFAGSQSGTELRWRINKSAKRPLQFAASAFVGLDDRYRLNGASSQASLGLRYKPFAQVNAVVGVDRMLKLGSQSRNAFALRLMADTGQNYEAPVDRARWIHWHAGFDSALIGVHARDLFASGDARIGMGFRLNDHWSVTPYVGANAILQKAGPATSLVEVGPGVWVRAKIDDSRRIDLRLAYRFNVSGNAKTKDGLVAQVAMGF
jgi:Bacteriophage N adsorption protein A C-term